MKLLKAVALAVGVLGCVALVIVMAPVVRGQVAQHGRPNFEFNLNGLMQGSRLGIDIRDVDAADVKREKLGAPSGAAIDEVHAGSPAEKAGIKAGDVVVTFDGETVRSARHLARLVDETPDGREVEATVVRNGERLSLKVAPEAGRPNWAQWGSFEPRSFQFRAPERFDLNIPSFDTREFRDRLRPYVILDGRGRLGVSVQELTGQLGEYFGAPTGVLVTDVEDGTPAKDAGLRAGDVITRINDQQVRTGAELRRQLTVATGDVKITFVRDRKEQTVTARLDPVEAPRPRIVRRVV